MPKPKRTDRSTVAEKNITFRGSPRTRALLDALVKAAGEEVAAAGGRVTIGTYLAVLIEREAGAKGIEVPPMPLTTSTAQTSPRTKKGKL